ncbi:MAG: hypothetical protein HN417_09435 [Desulfobacula sp.]|jgi:predicted Zn finger-like uncharacterized protein|nr:hypothetical protein [Desulfobacula sp.]MBT6341295.1 hypothetical protein [Desulfobacula sp.]
MNVTCHNCNTKLTISDDKIPKDKTSIFKCPKCKGKIDIPAVEHQKTDEINKRQSFLLSFGERLNALVCISGDELKKKVVSTAKQMGLKTEAVTNTKTALKRLEYHIYHLVIIDDAFDQSKGIAGIIDRMNTMDMSLRRRICLVWVTNKFNTNDNLASLHFSVNSILNNGDTPHLESFLSNSLLEHKHFYTVYNETLKMVGKG